MALADKLTLADGPDWPDDPSPLACLARMGHAVDELSSLSSPNCGIGTEVKFRAAWMELTLALNSAKMTLDPPKPGAGLGYLAWRYVAERYEFVASLLPKVDNSFQRLAVQFDEPRSSLGGSVPRVLLYFTRADMDKLASGPSLLHAVSPALKRLRRLGERWGDDSQNVEQINEAGVLILEAINAHEVRSEHYHDTEFVNLVAQELAAIRPGMGMLSALDCPPTGRAIVALADHLLPIAIQMDAPNNPTSHSLPAAPVASPNEVAPSLEQEPSDFSGGTMAFYANRVDFCGVDICSGPRSRTRRKLLDLLQQKRSDGSFVAYSGDKLAAEAGLTNGAPGAVRDLREAIRATLRDGANIICGKDDVILSGGPGYRLSESVVIELSPEIADMTADITDTGTDRDDHDQSDSDVLDVPDDPALNRQAWIVEQLENGVQLKGPDVVQNFACSAKTAQRDLTALKEAGTIEFVGNARSGYYRLCPDSVGDA